jgi:hypothetical protein
MDLKRMKNPLSKEKRPCAQNPDWKALGHNEFYTMDVVDSRPASSLQSTHSTDWVPLALKLPILH